MRCSSWEIRSCVLPPDAGAGFCCADATGSRTKPPPKPRTNVVRAAIRENRSDVLRIMSVRKRNSLRIWRARDAPSLGPYRSDILGLNYGDARGTASGLHEIDRAIHARIPRRGIFSRKMARRNAPRHQQFCVETAKSGSAAGCPLSAVTARRFCDQQEMSLHTATGRSLP